MAIDAWERDLAPSPELRAWFGHDPARYPEFRERYRAELRLRAGALRRIARAAEPGTVTLVYAARDPDRSNATVLQELLEEIRPGRRARAGRRSPGDVRPTDAAVGDVDGPGPPERRHRERRQRRG